MRKLIIFMFILSPSAYAEEELTTLLQSYSDKPPIQESRQINVNVNVFKEGESLCKTLNGLKYVSINSLTGKHFYVCNGYDQKISLSILKDK